MKRLLIALSMLAAFLSMQRALAAQNQRRPNVLLIMADDFNTSMGAYGNTVVKTPNLDRLAGRGVRFDRAYCQYPLCGPTRCSMLSGMRPMTIGVLSNQRPVRLVRKDVITLPQLFRNNGYFSARVGKIYHLGIPNGVGTSGPDDPPSWDYTFNPKGAEFTTDGEEFNPEPDFQQSFRRVMGKGDGAEQHDYQAADEAIRLLNEHKDKPFFLAVGFIRPHVPEIAPKKYFDLYNLDDIHLPPQHPNDRDDIPAAAFQRDAINWNMDEQQCRESIRAYYATTSFMDAQAGRVLDELNRLGLQDNTVVAFVGDHGYALGEHQTWQKMTLFEPVARVPLIIAAPGVAKEGGVARGLAEEVDIYPTLAALCGLKPPAETHEGASLVPMLKDPAANVKDAAFTSVRRRMSQGRSIRTDRWRYTEWTGQGAGAELYDHDNDPNEWMNLAHDPKYADVVRDLGRRLDEGGGVLPMLGPAAPASRPAATSPR